MPRQSRPPWTRTGTGAQWYFPSSRRPVSLSAGVVHVLPPSLDRRMTQEPYSLLVPIRYRASLWTNRVDHHCPLISARRTQVLPLSAEANTTVVSFVLPGPKKSWLTTYSPPGKTARLGEPRY